MENNQKKTFIAIGIVIVLALVVYYSAFYKKNQKASPANNNTATSTPPTQNLTPIKGALPPSFPVALLVGSSPTIVASGYSYDQANGQDVWVVTAISTKSIASFAKAYDAYFKTNKWKVLNKTQADRQLYYFALNPKSGANVKININTLPNSLNNIYITLRQPHAQ